MAAKKSKQKAVENKPEKKQSDNIFKTLADFYTKRDKETILKIINETNLQPYMICYFLMNDLNLIELLSDLDRFLRIDRKIFLTFLYYLIPKRNKAPFLKFQKAVKDIDNETEQLLVSKFEISKSEFRKFYKKYLGDIEYVENYKTV